MGALHAFQLLIALSPTVPDTLPHQARALRVTVLSTMLTDHKGVGEWGFAALVEVDGRRLLFDTGARPETVLQNARELGIDLSSVTDIVLSHHHADHTGGLLTLREALAKQNPAALSRAHVAEGFFLDRTSPGGRAQGNSMVALRAAYEAAGGKLVVHSSASEILPGVWVSGPIPRPHPERNWPRAGRIRTPQGMIEDSIPEDMSLYIDTPRGLVVITGCGHAGTVNTVQHAMSVVRQAPAYGLIGGLHLFASSDREVEWTAARLKEFRLAHLLGAHCTGIEAVYRLRQLAGLDRKTAVVGAVGSSFSLDGGIDPLALAR
jgi:7,8-dihydropterin-6-yl-methyl-4-(beta-D-ribofuranosyl)aminobenzene 5'-phosphate synthase